MACGKWVGVDVDMGYELSGNVVTYNGHAQNESGEFGEEPNIRQIAEN